MKISVVTVSLNAAATIAATLRSVAEQAHPDVEHIVIDGASNDGTQAVIEAYRGRLAHVVSEPDAGIYDAMNKGLHLATGEVVGFLNANDVYADRQVLATVAEAMADHSLDVLFGDVAYFRRRAPSRIVRRYSSRAFSPERIPYGRVPPHPALFMLRRIYAELGGYRTHYRIAGDFELIARAFSGGPLRYRYLPQILVLMEAGGISTAGLRSNWVGTGEVLQACRDAGIRTNLFKILSKYPAKLMELVRR